MLEELTVPLFEKWVDFYKNEKEVKQDAESLKKLHEDVFVRMHVDHIDYSDKIPEKFTKELYIATFQKIWATVRHDMYTEIQKAKKENRVEVLEEPDFVKIYNEIHQRFEEIRGDIYELMLDTRLDDKEIAREVMQKAYVTYSTVTHLKEDLGRSRWADQVNVILKKHTEYVNQMAQGTFYDGIENDPRKTKEADEKLDLESLPNYKPGLSKKKTFLTNEGRAIKSVKPGADKYVNKFVEMAKSKKAEI